MKKILVISILLGLVGCASSGQVEIEKVGNIEEVSPIVRAAGNNTYFTKIDELELSGIMYMRMGLSGFPQAVQLPEGSHTLKLWRDGNPDFEYTLKNITLENGHKYIVQYRVTPKDNNYYKITYWVEDFESGEVVYGTPLESKSIN